MAARFPISAVLRLKDLFSNQLTGVMNKAERRVAKTGDRMGGSLRKGISKRFAGAGKIIAGAAIGAGVTAGVAQAGARVLSFESTLEDIRVQMGRTRPEADALRDSIKGISKETGVSRAVILDGAEAIANLQGNTTELDQKLDVLARATVASRAPVAELASTWDALDKAFFRGKGSAADMEDALSAAIQAGKDGSVPLSQMGVLLGRVATQFDDVSFSGKRGIADMVAALQVVKGRGFGEAAEAATGMNAAIKQLIARAKPLQNLGVDVFEVKDGKRQLKDLRDILGQFKAKGLEDPLKLQEALKDSKAIKFIGALLDKDVRQKWDEIADSAANANSVQDDFAAKQDSNGVKIQKSLNRVKDAMDDAFTPDRITAVVSGLVGVVDGLEAGLSAANAFATGVGELAGNFAVFFGLAGREEELGTKEAVAKDLKKREGLAADRARAVELGILKGNVLLNAAVRDAEDEAGGAGGLDVAVEGIKALGIQAPGGSEETRLVERLLAQPGIVEGSAGAPDVRGLSPEAAAAQISLTEELQAGRAQQAVEIASAIHQGFAFVAKTEDLRKQAATAQTKQAATDIRNAAAALLTATGRLAIGAKAGSDTVEQAQLAKVAADAPSTGARE